MKRGRWLLLAPVVAAGGAWLWSSAPAGLPDHRAFDLVRAYNERKIEAYRTGDADLLVGLVGPIEDRKTGALIATKIEAGVFLDASLDEIELLGVRRPEAGGIDVSTAERWSYADRRIGTGERVGPASTDRYRMRYHLEHIEGRWVVATIAFETEPVVGRAEALGRRGGATIRHGGTKEGAGTEDPAAKGRSGGTR